MGRKGTKKKRYNLHIILKKILMAYILTISGLNIIPDRLSFGIKKGETTGLLVISPLINYFSTAMVFSVRINIPG